MPFAGESITKRIRFGVFHRAYRTAATGRAAAIPSPDAQLAGAARPLAPSPPRVRKTFDVAVHDFANGCPVVEHSRASKGFRGIVEVPFAAQAVVAVPAGKRIVLTKTFTGDTEGARAAYLLLGPVGLLITACTAAITFVPERGSAYVVRFVEPILAKAACGATVEKIVTAPGGRSISVVPETVAYPRELTGEAAFRRGGLCALTP